MNSKANLENQEKKRELKPKLRFPKFREVGEWKEKALGELSQIVRGGSPRPIDSYLTTDTNGLNWLKIGDVDQEAKYVTQTKEKVRLEALGKTREVHPNDLILSNSMSFGRPYILKIKTCIHDGWIAISKVDSSINVDYLYYYILSPLSQTYFLKNAAGSGVKNLNADIIKLLPTLIPQASEQQKIAGCLSSIDDCIAAENQKLNTLKAHKKGLMQQLFPVEGKTLPKLRFIEFRNSSDWEVKRIEDLSVRGSGHTPNKSQSSYYNGGIKWVSLADSNKLDNGYIYETKVEISKEGLKNSSAVLHPPGTVIISRDAGVGKSAVLYSEMAVSQHFIAWRCDESKLSNWFLYYFLQVLKPKFEAIATGSTIKTIGLPYFKEICITIPSVLEQKKIADCLISIDKLIAAQTQKIEALKLHKKGLMQQLFPSIDEVSG